MRRLLLTLTLASCTTGCGLLYDFESRPDAGPGLDATTPEAGLLDAGPFDAGPFDAGPVDAGPDAEPRDAGPLDAGLLDAGPFDAGPPCQGDSECDQTVVGACTREVCRDQRCVPGDADGDGICVDDDCDDDDSQIGANGFLECEVTAPGVCAHGAVRICTNGVVGPCVGGSPTAGELCNGLDDDCDGTADDGVATPTGPPGCAAPSAACEFGRWEVDPPTISPVMDACDGLDEDCDGSIDEDCVPTQGQCVFVSASAGPGTPADPTNPLTAFRSIGAALTWLVGEPSRPRQICLLANSPLGPCQPTRFDGVTVPAGVGIIGDLFSDLDGNVGACPQPGSTDIGAEPGGQAHSLRFLGSLPESPLQPTFVRNTAIAIPQLADIPTRAIQISVTAPTRVQEVRVRVRALASEVTGDGVHIQGGGQVVLSDVDVRYPNANPGSAVVADPGASLTLNRTRASVINASCDASSAVLAGGSDGWAVDAQGATVRGQRAVLCPGSAGAVRLDGGQLVLTRSVLLPTLSQPDIVGVMLRGGADGFLHQVTLAGGLGDGHTRVFVAEGPATTLRLTEAEVRPASSLAAASERTMIECIDATCVLSNSDMSLGGSQASDVVGLDCQGQARCIVEDSTLSAASLGSVESVGVSVGAGATALIRSSTVSGGCGANSTIGVDIEGAARIERSDIFGAARCESGPAVALEVDDGVVDALSSSFSSGVPAGAPCSGGTRAVYVAGSSPGEVVLRNSVFQGGACDGGGAIAVELNSSAGAVLAYCGLTQRGSVFADGAEIQDDSDARGNGLVAFHNVYTETPQFSGGPSPLSIASGSPFANAGGPGAPPLDRFGQPIDATPAMGCCEP